MYWLDPWWSTENHSPEFHQIFLKQLHLELPPDHALFGIPVRLIARGDSDDALFQFLDGSGKVAVVHLTWAKSQERLPWPVTTVFSNMQEFIEKRMVPDHKEFIGE
ncbi:hypothetical protein [Undibacterium macrobrachii]|uniref:Uncharacterized protein n=1 Tax=Undibacterium macrobrachii TaxID=1119058 RepID=A0ABQ2XLF8_9BURK|nr:hypothetical protein [Undibacterium macrobrachii]GGX22657.1 hypothetical protein GCM10011282_30870 [Undibacterium macrobrachii]